MYPCTNYVHPPLDAFHDSTTLVQLIVCATLKQPDDSGLITLADVSRHSSQGGVFGG